MRSHYNKKKRNKKITLIALIVFLLLVIFTPLYSYIYDVLEKPFSSASINTAHIQQKSANIFHTWFTKKKLVEENNRLKAENKLLQVDV
ncbi:MAG: hypothetical protein ACPGTS_02345, partial [Minisyncoccia bacterium]